MRVVQSMKDFAANCLRQDGGGQVCPYRIMIDDNFHYMEEDKRSTGRIFATAEEAIDACRRLVDRSLLHEYEQGGVTAEALYDRYTDFGDDPFVVALGGVPKVEFSAWNYAKLRAAELTAPGEEGQRRRQSVLDWERAPRKR
jgi:hypothetical protein